MVLAESGRNGKTKASEVELLVFRGCSQGKKCDKFIPSVMKRLRTVLFILILADGVAYSASPRFGDLAVLVAKGYFGNYVKQDASLEQCAVFLNRKGVQFSLFDLIDPNKTVTKEDCARAVGQSMLLFSGEAEVVNGGIKKPLDAKTWVDYCLLNDVDLRPIWDGLVQRTAEGHLPEVQKFFGLKMGRQQK